MKKTTLAEIMGSQASKGISLGNLPEILGEGMPELPRTTVGRHRLIRALQQRFGNNWRSLPGVKEVVSEFDEEVRIERKIAQIKNIRYTPKEK